MITFVQNYKKCQLQLQKIAQLPEDGIDLWRGRWKLITREHEKAFGDNGYVRYLDCDDGSQVHTYVKTHPVVHNMYSLLYVNYSSMKLLKRENKQTN